MSRTNVLKKAYTYTYRDERMNGQELIHRTINFTWLQKTGKNGTFGWGVQLDFSFIRKTYGLPQHRVQIWCVAVPPSKDNAPTPMVARWGLHHIFHDFFFAIFWFLPKKNSRRIFLSNFFFPKWSKITLDPPKHRKNGFRQFALEMRAHTCTV